MSEATRGNKLLYKFRLYSERSTLAAWGLAFATENGRSLSADADSTETKDGSIRTPGTAEEEVTGSYLYKKGDYTKREKLETAIANGSLFEIWEINMDEAGSTTGTYRGKYMQGYLTEMSNSSPADDFATVDLTFGVNGTGQFGDCTLSSSEAEIATYAFADTTVVHA